jgi:hypothetical protein
LAYVAGRDTLGQAAFAQAPRSPQRAFRVAHKSPQNIGLQNAESLLIHINA